MDIDNDTKSILFGEIPLNGTDTTNYAMKRPQSNGSAADVEIKNHINSMKSNSADTSAVINIDVDGKSNFIVFFSFFFKSEHDREVR